ncbi:MAG TPA: biopolymer transporter ExbD [Flavisolibacter sp.]|jgi:biopolymer transport protein ExbD|nr:biopolymer transporter ExbD [Flavisolibacter sp.]
MASVDVSGGDSGHKKGPGVKKAKKLSTRVDMTPMVDLGFLLITFFIFTTTMSTPSTMKLVMPKDDKDKKDQTEIKESDALTILMGKGNQVYYYMGQLKSDGSNFTSSNYSDIRKVISDKKKDVMVQGKSLGYPADTLDKDFVIVIKPNKEATYKNIVDMLDEMTINAVHRFAMVDITEDENKLVKATEQRNGVK